MQCNAIFAWVCDFFVCFMCAEEFYVGIMIYIERWLVKMSLFYTCCSLRTFFWRRRLIFLIFFVFWVRKSHLLKCIHTFWVKSRSSFWLSLVFCVNRTTLTKKLLFYDTFWKNKQIFCLYGPVFINESYKRIIINGTWLENWPFCIVSRFNINIIA